MGDTGGALFQGYVYAAFILISMKAGYLPLWTWIIVMGYFLGDTVHHAGDPRLYREAVVGHLTVGAPTRSPRPRLEQPPQDDLLALAIDCGWLLPLALASARWPQHAVPLAAVALAPIVALTVRFGPLYDK